MNYTKPRIKNETSYHSTESINDFLKSHPVGVLSTSDKNNKPHAAVLYFSVDPDFSITFTTKRDTQKHRNMQHHKQVMLVVYDADTQTTVQIAGKVQDISNESEAAAVFQGTLKAAQTNSKTGVPPISKLFAGHYVAYRILPSTVRSARFLQSDADGYDIFETIEFDD